MLRAKALLSYVRIPGTAAVLIVLAVVVSVGAQQERRGPKEGQIRQDGTKTEQEDQPPGEPVTSHDGMATRFSKITHMFFGSNCSEKKSDLRERFDEVKFGSCNHPTSVDADAYAYSVLATQLAESGAVFNVEIGHKTIDHDFGPNTFLSYAAGDFAP